MKIRTQNVRMISWILPILILFAVVLMPASSYAKPRAADDEEELPNARLQGYTIPVAQDSDSTALNWGVLVILGALGVAIMFKDAHRTHLD